MQSAGVFPAPRLAGGITDAHTTVPGRQHAGARRQTLPGSARHQYHAQLAWLAPPSAWADFGANLGYTYIGEAHNDIASDRRINDYSTWNATLRGTVSRWSGRPALGLTLNNITDEIAAISISAGNNGDFYVLNPPRTLVARFSLEFD